MGYQSNIFFPSLHMLALGLSLKPCLPPVCGFIYGYHSKPSLYERFLSSFGGMLKLPPVTSCELNCI